MPILFKIADSAKDKETVYRLRYKVFVEQEQRFGHQTPYIVDMFDSFRETFNILALKDGEPIGTIRVVMANPVGLPAAEHYDFSSYIEGFECECACIGWLCILKEYRTYHGLLFGLFKMAVHEMKKHGAQHVIATLHPPVMRLLQRSFNAKRAGNDFESGGLGVSMTPAFIDINAFPPPAREAFEDCSELILQDSNVRKIYHEGEIITTRGTEGDEAFLILRGAVRVLPVGVDGKEVPIEALGYGRIGDSDLLFSKGAILGELSLLDCGARTATIIPYSSEVDVMVWSKDVFMKQLKDHEGKALDICRLLGNRLRRQILKETEPVGSGRSVAAAHVLCDASNEGEKTVEAVWLARQCGIWPEAMAEIADGWRKKGIVAIEEGKFRVLDPTELLRSAARRSSDEGI